MSWMTSRPALLLRNIGRTLGLNARIARLLQWEGYEARYDEAFQRAIRPGDCVWDIGANIGHYTRIFAQRVGDKGRVLAYEPSPINFARLRDACEALSNVSLFNYALGAQEGEASFQQGADDLGATSRVVGLGGGGGVIVPVRTGDGLISQGDARAPNAIKVDVEGFEPEVMGGLGLSLLNPGLRVIGIEVHFGLLAKRGLPGAARSLEALLVSRGFSVTWPDSSHILAVRGE
jgi:FkbM family methyltransferase